MTFAEHKAVLLDLADYFGGKVTDAKIQGYFDKLKGYEASALMSACESSKDNNRTFPTRGELATLCRESGGSGRDQGPRGCSRCHDGFIPAHHPGSRTISAGVYDFRCTCQAGTTLSTVILVWSNDWREKGYTPQFRDQNHFEGMSA